MNKIAITIIVAFLTYSASAQDAAQRHELSMNFGDGFSSFQTNPSLGKNQWKNAIRFGLGYHYLFNPNWGVGTGVNFATYKGGMSIKHYDQKQSAVNVQTGNPFNFLVTSPKYKETQQVTMITIPLMAMYQYEFEEKRVFYAELGFKLGFPVSGKSQAKGDFTTKGYYPNLNVTYDDLPVYGFVTNHPFPADKTDIELRTSLMISLETGIKWLLTASSNVYAGIFVDCGLNNMLKEKAGVDKNLVVYQSNTPDKFAYNPAIKSYASKMKPFTIGLTVRYSFQLTKK